MKPLLRKNCKLGQGRNCLKEKGQKDAPRVIKCERCSEVCDKIKKILDVVTDFQCCVMLHRDRWGLSDQMASDLLLCMSFTQPFAAPRLWWQHGMSTQHQTLLCKLDRMGEGGHYLTWTDASATETKFIVLKICCKFNFKIYIPISMPRPIILISIYIIWTICFTVENSNFMTVA